MKLEQQRILVALVWLLAGCVCHVARADVAGDSLGEMHKLLTDIVRSNIPHTYEDTSKWGMTSERWDGLHLRLDGLRLKTKRRKKVVNDGDWQMYRISLIDPREQFSIRVWNVHGQPDGRIGFECSVAARVHAFGRTSQWVKGVQLYSFGVDADANLTLYIRGSVGLKFDITKAPPDVLLDPHVSRALVHLDHFELERLSNLRGDAAEQLGRSLREVIESQVAKNNNELAGRLNREIEKNRDDLRLSLHDVLASKWGSLVEKHKAIKPDQTQGPLEEIPQ